MFSDQIKLSVLYKTTSLLLGLFCWQLMIAQKKIDLTDLMREVTGILQEM